MIYRPYVSVDIETVGLNIKSSIIEIAAIFDDLKSPVNELKTFHVVIKHEVLEGCENYALGMNAELFKKMMDKNFNTSTPVEAAANFLAFLSDCQIQAGRDSKGVYPSLLLAGKNVANFDIPRLEKLFLENSRFSEESIKKLLGHRSLDVGSLYYPTLGDNVSLSKINELTGRKQVSHQAMDDAMDVVYAVRNICGINIYKFKLS